MSCWGSHEVKYFFWDKYGTISYMCCDIHIIYGIFSFLVHVLILCTSVNLHVLIRFSILTIQLLGYPHFRKTPYEQSSKLPNTKICIRWTLVFIKRKTLSLAMGPFQIAIPHVELHEC